MTFWQPTLCSFCSSISYHFFINIRFLIVLYQSHKNTLELTKKMLVKLQLILNGEKPCRRLRFKLMTFQLALVSPLRSQTSGLVGSLLTIPKFGPSWQLVPWGPPVKRAPSKQSWTQPSLSQSPYIQLSRRAQAHNMHYRLYRACLRQRDF